MSRRSMCRPAPAFEVLEDRLAPATFLVTNDNDSGDGSLREAILAANAAPGADAIEFNIPGAGLKSIDLASPLPTISGKVSIDGVTQPGFFLSPLIELNGAGAGSGAHGLNLSASATGSFIRGLIINRFDGDGIRIRASNSRVEYCFIGTNAAGTVAQGNEIGVRVLGGADGVRVGGKISGQGNLISGNEVRGVLIEGAGTTGNKVQGNFIGTTADGNSALANQVGVAVISGASGNVIGGTVEPARNVISGNSQEGVFLVGAGTSGNALRGNFIGTDRTGLLALGNGNSGIFVYSGADSNTIGGTTPEARNIISANGNIGVVLIGNTGNTIQGNYIGVDANGTADLGNASHGISIGVANGTLVGGADDGARNVIAGNGAEGIRIGISSSGNKVKGNLIGLNRFGGTAIPNALNGVLLEDGATGNVIGGTAADAANVISGNTLNGVHLTDPETRGNRILGNFIGTRSGGLSALPNGFSGVLISTGASNNTIGGTVSGSRNVISGNGINGITLGSPNTTGNQVQGNFIGLDATGAVALANGSSGVFISASATLNLIGGTTPAARNVISGNTQNGVTISGVGTDDNKVQGNYIGTDKTGSEPLANGISGVNINTGAANNAIGGTAAGAGNVLSGNGESGVRLNANTNRIRGNRIGLAAKTNDAVGNTDYGVHVQSSFNQIGGTADGAGNLIAHNGEDGIFVDIFVGNSIQRNRIFDNGGLGIDLGDNGVTANDANDVDNGPNTFLNFPVLNTVELLATGVRITGSINTALNSILRIEFFASPNADGSTHGEGKRYLGYVMVQVLGSTTVNFSKTLAVTGVTAGQVITATATDQAGNTSEFSLALLVA